jgi:ketosteroid isomerase-like protein
MPPRYHASLAANVALTPVAGDAIVGPLVTEEQVTGWLEAYGEAFERQDPEAGAALFTPDATYQWGPFGELLHGKDEIRAKWAEAIDPREEDVTFAHELLAVTDTIAIARWMASFAYPREGRLVRYDGVFAFSLNDESRCTEFREWWNTREEPLEG